MPLPSIRRSSLRKTEAGSTWRLPPVWMLRFPHPRSKRECRGGCPRGLAAGNRGNPGASLIPTHHRQRNRLSAAPPVSRSRPPEIPRCPNRLARLNHQGSVRSSACTTRPAGAKNPSGLPLTSSVNQQVLLLVTDHKRQNDGFVLVQGHRTGQTRKSRRLIGVANQEQKGNPRDSALGIDRLKE